MNSNPGDYSQWKTSAFKIIYSTGKKIQIFQKQL
jgi:hypothetical protein